MYHASAKLPSALSPSKTSFLHEFLLIKGSHLRRTPGIQPKIERQMLIKKSAPNPAFRKTGTGGSKSAIRYMHTSYYLILSTVAFYGRVREVTFDDVAILNLTWLWVLE
jgi:hypothetical protein